MTQAYRKPGRPPAPVVPRGPTLDSRIDGVLVRTVAAGLLASMRRDGGAWGEVMIARQLRRHDLGPEHVEAVAGAMVSAGLLMRVAGAMQAWKARQP